MTAYPEKIPVLLWSTEAQDKGDSALRNAILDRNMQITDAKDPEHCLQLLRSEDFRALFIYSVSNAEGWKLDTLMHAVHSSDMLFPVILVSQELSPELLHALYRSGLFDALSLQNLDTELTPALNALLQFIRNRDSFPPEALQLFHTQGYGPLTGNSESMQKLYALLVRVLDRDLTVSIFGDSGTGKEIVARFLHHYSKRSEKRFVTINCAAVPEALLESELFGHEKGAFTGANSERIGKFEYAHEGSLFLDEIGEMSLPLQAKLLRIIETAQFERVGSNESRNVNVRLITATNRDLEKEVEKGQFRRDLLFRISVFPLHLSSLNQRHHDAVLLTHRFIDRNTYGEYTGISSKLSAYVCRNIWEGNIRELENTLTRCLVMGKGPVLDLEDDDFDPLAFDPLSSHAALTRTDSAVTLPPPEIEKISDMEKWLIDRVMKRAAGNISEAARRLGISRVALYRKLAAEEAENTAEDAD